MNDYNLADVIADEANKIVELNVGGTSYLTTIETLRRDPNSIFGKFFSFTGSVDSKFSEESTRVIRQVSGGERRYFIDRNGELFRYILDYLRNDKRIVLPDRFNDCNRLRNEARFYKMDDLLSKLTRLTPGTSSATGSSSLNFSLPLLNAKYSSGGRSNEETTFNGTSAGLEIAAKSDGETRVSTSSTPDPLVEGGHLTVGYRGTFAFGRDGKGDVKFRKLNRILICGKAQLCKRVFGDALNESRDPDRGGSNRYTSRLYLKHCNLEWAFDTLSEHGFSMAAGCASGTCFAGLNDAGHSGRTGADGEEQRWNHYNEFIFFKPPE